MTPIIIFVLIALSVLVLYTILNKPKTEFEDTFVPSAKIKKFKPTKPKSSIKPVSSGVSSGPAKPLGKIEEPALKRETPLSAKPTKTEAKPKAKKPAPKKSKKPKNNGDQLLHS
jgi:hypothetical protein